MGEENTFPRELRVAHLMHVTGWTWQELMSTPISVLDRYLLVTRVQQQKQKDDLAMRGVG